MVWAGLNDYYGLGRCNIPSGYYEFNKIIQSKIIALHLLIPHFLINTGNLKTLIAAQLKYSQLL